MWPTLITVFHPSGLTDKSNSEHMTQAGTLGCFYGERCWERISFFLWLWAARTLWAWKVWSPSFLPHGESLSEHKANTDESRGNRERKGEMIAAPWTLRVIMPSDQLVAASKFWANDILFIYLFLLRLFWVGFLSLATKKSHNYIITGNTVSGEVSCSLA